VCKTALGDACDVNPLAAGAAPKVCDNTKFYCSTTNMNCTAWVMAGAACTTSSDCQVMSMGPMSNTNWVCYMSKCTDASTIPIPAGCRGTGDQCAADSDCVTGLKCTGGMCAGLALGATCVPLNLAAATSCDVGLVCSLATLKCTAMKNYGDLVTSTTTDLCPVAGYVTSDMKCASFYSGASGAACTYSEQCAKGLYCMSSGGAGTCAAEANLTAVGTACSVSDVTACNANAMNDINRLTCGCDAKNGATKCMDYTAGCSTYMTAIMMPKLTCNGYMGVNGVGGCTVPSTYPTDTQFGEWMGSCGMTHQDCNAVSAGVCAGQNQINGMTIVLPTGNVCGFTIPFHISATCHSGGKSAAAGLAPVSGMVAALFAVLALIR